MKTCPVCNESFVDEMNFCDVDGSPLDRDPISAAHAKNKLWSMLGVALLIGALALSVIVVFMPRPRPASAVVGTEAPLTSAAPQPPSPELSSSSNPPARAAEPENVAPVSADIPEAKPRERTADLLKAGAGSAPNPKAAALDPNEEPATRRSESEEHPVALKPESTKTPKAAAIGADGEPVKSVKTAETSKEAGKTASAKPGDKDKKAVDEKDKDKKKGGFFKVFKKIFGKKDQ
jgi:hypothetical protein